ncbi:PAS domain S-box protein [Sorangium sp. So ce131]|uniref:PAS domain S-box protein n=1 Tax=Sorangium sp. So ce131 TaxID=3133282 RepID=UPI003F5FF4D5
MMESSERAAGDAEDTAHAEGKYERALRRASFAVVECTTEGRILRWNEGATRLFGYTEDEVIGRSVAGTLLATGGEEAFRRACAAEPAAVHTWTGIRKDGGARTCIWSFERLADERGHAAGLLCFGREITAKGEAIRALERDSVVLRAILDNLDILVWVVDSARNFTYLEGKAVRSVGLPRDEVLGRSVYQFYPEETVPHIGETFTRGAPMEYALEAHDRSWRTWTIPIHGERGRVDEVLGVTLDVTEQQRLQAEAEARVTQLERQQRVIRQLATPIIEVWEGVLALPMIGVIDSSRTAEVMDSLLEAMVREGARFAVLDLTGVEAVDTQTASYLINLIRAIRLLGAEGIVTGIRSNVAQTLVGLGVDLGAITTLGNLRAGLRYCIARSTQGAPAARR